MVKKNNWIILIIVIIVLAVIFAIYFRERIDLQVAQCFDNDNDGFLGYDISSCPTGNDCNDDPLTNGANIFPGNSNNYCDCDASSGIVGNGWSTENGLCDDNVDNDCNLLVDCNDNACNNNPICTGTICGNSKIEIDEECDDGNLVDGDGCDLSCKIESGRTCYGSPSTCYWIGQEKIDVIYNDDGPLFLTGDEEIVFDWTTDRCEYINIPDLGIQPWRDNQGTIHLILPHVISYKLTGTDFSNLRIQCDSPVYKSHGNPDPSMYDSHEWIGGKWFDENTGIVHALVHNEYHANQYPSAGCNILGDCNWWSILYFYSIDGGETFKHDPAPEHFVYGPPYLYEPNVGNVVSIDTQTNILFKDGYYYTLLNIIGPYRDISAGIRVSIMRTDDLSNPGSWKAWDGDSFSIETLNPYINPVVGPEIPKIFDKIGGFANSLSDNSYLSEYLFSTTEQKSVFNHFTGQFDAYRSSSISTSDDLLNWDFLRTYRFRDQKYSRDVMYPSIVDHNSPSKNFEVSTRNPHLYFVRWYNQYELLNRDLIRLPLNIIKKEDYDIYLSGSGFDYFGVTKYNHPVVGNDYLELIGININGIDYYEDIVNSELSFDINEVRAGIRGNGQEIILNEKRSFSEYYTFLNAGDYNNFIQSGVTSGGVLRSSSFFDSPFVMSGGIGFIPDNVEPSVDQALISEDGNLSCSLENLQDPNFDVLDVSYSFKVKKDIGQEFTFFENMIHSFEVLEEIPSIAEFSSDKIIDLSGVGNDITNYYLDFPTIVPGIYGNGALFDGNDLLFVGDQKGLDLGGSKTFEFWIKTTQNSHGVIASFDDPTDSSSFYYYIYLLDGRAYLSFSYDGVTEHILDTGQVADNTMHHIAFVLDFNNNEIRSYLDGSLIENNPWPTGNDSIISFTKLSYFIFGGSFQYPLSTFVGLLDEFRVYNLALSDSMITSHSNLNYSVVTLDMIPGNQEWKCGVVPSDGKIYGDYKESSSLLIQNCVPEICSDGIDNDCDGDVDCQDSECSSNSACSSPPKPEEEGGGGGGGRNRETTNPQCSDGKDNDGDGLIDYPDDPGCTSLTDDSESNIVTGQNLNGTGENLNNTEGEELESREVRERIFLISVIIIIIIGIVVVSLMILRSVAKKKNKSNKKFK